MAPCVIIPTFWTRRRGGRATGRNLSPYDHPTPLDESGTLPDCLRSLEGVRDLERVVVIVAATHPSVEHEAEDRVREILDDFPGIDALVFGRAELGSLHRRLEQLEFSDMIQGVKLDGYGAVRNVGLMVAGTLGCETVVFLDDDQIITDPEFLEIAQEGIGDVSGKGTPVLAKTGFYRDTSGRWQRPTSKHWADMFWRQNESFNRAMQRLVGDGPRLRPSNLAFGGCLALHRDMFANVSFDPWVARGEDSDYVVNVRMHGGDMFIDADWSVIHQPPEPPSEAFRFRQEVFRFVYMHRKLEFAKSQVDLRQVSPESLEPFPGDFVGQSVSLRAVLTAALRALSGRESGAYLRIMRRTLSEANRYARRNCDNYFAFQRRWPLLMDSIWEDIALKSLFTGERRVDRTAITGRFPVLRNE